MNYNTYDNIMYALGYDMIDILSIVISKWVLIL